MTIEDRDILQIDATVIAGILVLFTLTNIAGDTSHIKGLVGYVSVTAIPFTVSAFLILNASIFSITAELHKTYVRISTLCTILGFSLLIIIFMIFFVEPILLNVHTKP